MDTGAHRAQLDPQGDGDLLVRETFDVAQDHRSAVLGGERVQGALDVVVEVGVLVPTLGRTRPLGGGDP